MARVTMSVGSSNVPVRRSTGAYIGGRWQTQLESDVTIRAAIRPVSPSSRILGAEGMRTEDSITILTSAKLAVETSNVDGSRDVDRVLWNGLWWKVVGEKDWSANGFRRYLATREDKAQ